MNKKKIIMLISVAIVVCLIPSTIFAGSIKKHKVKKPIHHDKQINRMANEFSKKYKEDNGEDDLSVVQSLLRDLVNYFWASEVKEYDTADPKKKTYSKDVWSELNEVYRAINTKINNAKSPYDLIQMTALGAMPSNDILEQLFYMKELGKMTVQIVPNGYKDLPEQRKELNKLIEKTFKYKSRPKSIYNDFYWGKYCDAKKSLKSDAKRIKSFRDLVKVKEELSSKNPEDPEETSGIEIDGEDIPTEQWVYTNKQLDRAKKIISRYSAKLVRKLKNKHNKEKKNIKLADTLLKKFNKTVKNGYDMDLMVKQLDDFIIRLDKIFEDKNMKHPMMTGDRERAKKRLEAIFMDYRKKDYSDSNWENIMQKHSDTIEELEDAEYIEDADEIIKNFGNALKKVPTKAKELKLQRKKYIKIFLKMGKASKYDKKKIHKIIRKAKAELYKADSLEKLKSVYKIYLKKAKRTVITFKIKVKKTGAGTVSKSKRIQYGGSYKVRLTPNPGHRIAKVVIDGKARTLRNTYSFKNVKKTHIIVVNFQ